MSDNGRGSTNSTSIDNAQNQETTSAQTQPQSYINPSNEQKERQPQQQSSSHQPVTHSNAKPTLPSTPSQKPSSTLSSAPLRPSPPPSTTTSSSILQIPIPGPLKKLFDRFPLITYSPNELPLGAPLDRQRHYRYRQRQRQHQQQQQQLSLNRQKDRDSETEDGRELQEHTLYVFTSEDEAELGLPSFNPGCLKWQAYLKFQGIRFRTVKSNNHASPNGILPFLIPASAHASTITVATEVPISSGGLKKWADGQGVSAPSSARNGEIDSEERNGLVDARHEAYMSLISTYIRRAWLHNLYLNPSNFSSVAYPRYIQSASSNTLLQASLSSNLRAAAVAELVKQDTDASISNSRNNTIDQNRLYEQADEAFEALAVRLLDSRNGDVDDKVKWLSGRENPGLADAALFAYTHLLLGERMGWADEQMVEMLKGSGRESIVRHRDRILEMYFCL